MTATIVAVVYVVTTSVAVRLRAITVASVQAQIESVRRQIDAVKKLKKETKAAMPTTTTKTTDIERERRRTELAARMGMSPDVPDIKLEHGVMVYGVISKADGRILSHMSPAARRELAAATGSAKAKLWESAKAKVTR